MWPLPTTGGHAVGVEVTTRLDRSRPYKLDAETADARGRPIRMLIWYPAMAGADSPPMDYRGYLLADDGLAPGDALPRERQQALADRLAARRELDEAALDAAVERLLAVPFRGRREVDRAPGRHPLVVIAPGGTTPPSLHALLGEHLASHGYVAVAIPSLPAHQGERWPFDPTGIDLHLRDMELALDHLLADPAVDPARIGLVNWSVGGVAQALMAMRNPDVGALASLDGATGYAYGLELLRQSIHFRESGLDVPYLHAHGLAPARYEVEKEFTVFESLSTGPSFLLTFPELSHADFMSRALIDRWAVDPTGSASVVEAYAILLETTRRFLDTYLSAGELRDEAFRTWLARREQRRVFTTRARPGSPGPGAR